MIIAFSTTSRFCASCLENCCLLLFMLLHHTLFVQHTLKEIVFCPKRQITPILKKLNVISRNQNTISISKCHRNPQFQSQIQLWYYQYILLLIEVCSNAQQKGFKCILALIFLPLPFVYRTPPQKAKLFDISCLCLCCSLFDDRGHKSSLTFTGSDLIHHNKYDIKLSYRRSGIENNKETIICII